MLLSIIIPVYNIEKYIGQCLDSILQCRIDDCQIILVTGNSIDRSNEICEEYRNKFLNICVLRQSGTGLSNARNCALDMVSGKYIVYVDGDDYIDSKNFDKLIQMLRIEQDEIDLLVTDFKRISDVRGRVENIYQIGENSTPQKGMDYLPQMLRKKQCFWNVWRFIYRRAFLEKYGIRFRENMMSEDVDYTTKALLANPKILFIHCPYYYYRVGRGNSLMDSPTYQRLEDTIEILCSSIHLAEKSSFQYSQLLIEQYQFEYILNIAITSEIADKDKANARKLYKETLDILCVGTYGFAHFFHGVMRVLPIIFIAEVLHILKICRRTMKRRLKK